MTANEKAIMSRNPAAAIAGDESMLQPIRRPEIDISTIGISPRTMWAAAWPPSTAPRAIGSDRNRSTAPLRRSDASAIATPNMPKKSVWAKMPPIRNST